MKWMVLIFSGTRPPCTERTGLSLQHTGDQRVASERRAKAINEHVDLLLRLPTQALCEILECLVLSAHMDSKPQQPLALTGTSLLVDDDRLVLKSLFRALTNEGYCCLTATSHMDAIKALVGTPEISLVVIDWNMPEGDPRRLVQTIKGIRPGLPIVGNSGRDHRADFAAIGVEIFLEKPWTLDQLVTTLSLPPSPDRYSPPVALPQITPPFSTEIAPGRARR